MTTKNNYSKPLSNETGNESSRGRKFAVLSSTALAVALTLGAYSGSTGTSDPGQAIQDCLMNGTGRYHDGSFVVPQGNVYFKEPKESFGNDGEGDTRAGSVPMGKKLRIKDYVTCLGSDDRQFTIALMPGSTVPNPATLPEFAKGAVAFDEYVRMGAVDNSEGSPVSSDSQWGLISRSVFEAQ